MSDGDLKYCIILEFAQKYDRKTIKNAGYFWL